MERYKSTWIGFDGKKHLGLIDKIKAILKANNYLIASEWEIPYGYRIKLSNDCIILIYPHKYKYCFQGKNVEKVSKLLKENL